MTTRNSRKAPPRKAPARKARKSAAVDSARARCGTAKLPPLFDDLGPQELSALAASSPALGPIESVRLPPRLSADELLAAQRLTESGISLEAAIAVVRREVYGYTPPVMALSATVDRAIKAFEVSNDCAPALPPTRKARPLLPEYAFNLRRELDSVHSQLRALIFTLEPVLQIGPRSVLLERPLRPTSAKPDDPNERREAELTCALEQVEDSVVDLQVILANLSGVLALPHQDDPDRAAVNTASPSR